MSDSKFRKALESISSYTPAKSLEEIRQDLGLDNIIRLSANENTMGCSPLVATALKQAVEDIYLYPDGFCMKLRRKLAESYNFNQEQLIFGNGSFELLSLIAQALINPGDESLIPEPSFGWYKVVTLAMGGVIVSVPLKNHVIDLDEITSKVTNKTRIVWLCNPNNPTGTILTQPNLEKFLTNLPQDITIVLDEAYYEYVTDIAYPDSVALIKKYPNIIVLRTFSKVYGLASLRVGYGIADQEMINTLNKIRLPINVNALAQVAAEASLNDQNFKNAVLENNRQGKDYYYKSFKKMGLEYIPSETNFIMVNVKKDSVTVSNEILKGGIAVRAGTEFGMPTWLRITIGKPDENTLLVEILKKVL